MRQAAKKIESGIPLAEVKHELEGKTSDFINFFRYIDSAPLSHDSKEEMRDAINKKTPLDQVKALFLEHMGSASLEERVRNECPGCLMGRKEWTHLGVAQKVPPLTEEILAALHETSPSDPTKEAWQTGILVLVPEIVDEKPLTLNRLVELMKKKFPDIKSGHAFITVPVVAKYGEAPAGKSHWELIERGVLPSSQNKNFQEQEAIVKAPYEVPEFLPVAVGIILNYLNSENEERLFRDSPQTYTRCKEMVSGNHVLVGVSTAVGLEVSHHGDDSDAFNGLGVRVRRKLGH